MHVFVDLGVQVGSRLCSYAQLDDSLTARSRRASSLRARQTSQSRPATSEDHSGRLAIPSKTHARSSHASFLRITEGASRS
jgi:hypothetical protein